MTVVKFCGLTKPGDAELAARLGAAYVGVIFAESPRRVDVSTARAVLEPTRGSAAAVGVFGPAAPDEILQVAHAVRLDVVQLHADPSVQDVERVRASFDGEVWATYRARESRLSSRAGQLADVADGIVLDPFHDAMLGGTGRTFDWAALAASLVPLRSRRAFVILAGGLRAANVAGAVELLVPDVVDVSSGVESAPGIKDHEQMRAFMDAVRDAAHPRS